MGRGGWRECPASCIALEMMGKQVDLCFLSYCTNGMWHFGSCFSPSELSHFSGFPKLPSSRNPCPRRAWRAAFRPYTPASLSGNGEGSRAVARQEECHGVQTNISITHAALACCLSSTVTKSEYHTPLKLRQLFYYLCR